MNRKLFIWSIFCLILFSCEKHQKIDWGNRTVLVYMAADNSLSSEGNSNIQQMLRGMQNVNGRLVIYFDPAYDVPRLMTIKGGKDCKLDTIATYEEENSASPEILKRVVEDTRNKFPADSYGLIMWSHGMGWLPQNYYFQGAVSKMSRKIGGPTTKYFGQDWHPGDQVTSVYMEALDMARALPAGFQFILFDACFMSSIEVLYELRLKTDYVIASPAEVISLGFPYEEIVPLLWEGEDQLKQVCQTFYNFYKNYPNASDPDWNSATVAMVKTSELEPLMVEAYSVLKDRNDFQQLNVWRYPLSKAGLPDVFYDLGDYINSVGTTEQKAAFQKQLSKTVLYKAATSVFFGTSIPADKFSGITTYLPKSEWATMNDFYFTYSWPQLIYDK